MSRSRRVTVALCSVVLEDDVEITLHGAQPVEFSVGPDEHHESAERKQRRQQDLRSNGAAATQSHQSQQWRSIHLVTSVAAVAQQSLSHISRSSGAAVT